MDRLLYCPVCTFGCNDQESWMSHLMSEGHRATQSIHLLWNWPREKDDRAVVIALPSQQQSFESEVDFDIKVDFGFFNDVLRYFFKLSHNNPSNIEDFYIDPQWNLAVLLLKNRGSAVDLLNIACEDPFFQSIQQIMLKSTYYLDQIKFDTLEKIQLTQPGTEENPEESSLFHIERALKTIDQTPLNLNQQLLYLLECYAATKYDIEMQQTVFDEFQSILRQKLKFILSSIRLVDGAGCHFGYKFRPLTIKVYINLEKSGFSSISDLRREVSKVMTESKSFSVINTENREDFNSYSNLQIRNLTSKILIKVRILTDALDKNKPYDQTLMAYLMSFDVRAAPLTNFILLWNKVYHIGVPVPDIMTLVIVFLIKKGVIPSIHLLQNLQPKNKREICDGWDFSLCNDEKRIKKHFDDLPQILPANGESFYDALNVLRWAREWFQWLGEHCLENSVVSVLAGDIIPREEFLPGAEQNLPEVLKKKYLLTPEGLPRSENQKLNVHYKFPIIIQHPFILSTNMSHVQRGRVRRLQSHCRETLIKIDKALTESNLLGIFPPVGNEEEKGLNSNVYNDGEYLYPPTPTNEDDFSNDGLSIIHPDEIEIKEEVEENDIKIRIDLGTPPASPKASLSHLFNEQDPSSLQFGTHSKSVFKKSIPENSLRIGNFHPRKRKLSDVDSTIVTTEKKNYSPTFKSKVLPQSCGTIKGKKCERNNARRISPPPPGTLSNASSSSFQGPSHNCMGAELKKVKIEKDENNEKPEELNGVKFSRKIWFDISGPDFMDIILNAVGKYTPPSKNDRMKAKNLWLTFVEDFFTQVWHSCFNIEATSLITKKEVQPTGKDKGTIENFLSEEPIWLRKWKELPTTEQSFYQVSKLNAPTYFWTDRDRLTETLADIMKGSCDQIHSFLFEKDVTELCAIHQVRQSLQNIAMSKSVEESPDILPLRIIPEFICEIKLRTSDAKPTILRHANHLYYFALSPMGNTMGQRRKSQNHTQNAIVCLNKVLSKMIPRYAKKRLQDWLTTTH